MIELLNMKSNLHEAASNFYLRVEKRCTVDDLLNKEQESEKKLDDKYWKELFR